MEIFAKLFGSLLALVYHCFDRIVILGHLPLLTRPENIVHFFRDIHQVEIISKEVLRQRTDDYHHWVEAFARKRKLPMEWAEKGVRKEDYVRPHLRRMERRNQFGVYFILKSMELGPTFRSAVPRFPVDDPNYRILPGSVPATPTITSIFAMKSWDRSPYASALSCLFPSLTTSTAIISSNANSSVPGCSFAKTTTPFSGWLIQRPYRRPPTVSARRSFASSSIIGPG